MAARGHAGCPQRVAQHGLVCQQRTAASELVAGVGRGALDSFSCCSLFSQDSLFLSKILSLSLSPSLPPSTGMTVLAPAQSALSLNFEGLPRQSLPHGRAPMQPADCVLEGLRRCCRRCLVQDRRLTHLGALYLRAYRCGPSSGRFHRWFASTRAHRVPSCCVCDGTQQRRLFTARGAHPVTPPCRRVFVRAVWLRAPGLELECSLTPSTRLVRTM